MREMLFLLLFIPWMAGMVTERTFDGGLHVLLAVATAMVVTRVLQGENPLGESAL